MLHESPELVHRFYQEVSKLGRPEQNGLMGITTTMLVSSLSLTRTHASFPVHLTCFLFIMCITDILSLLGLMISFDV